MYEYDEYNPKKKDEYEETEQESIAYSADGMEDEPHVDGESIEMEAEVISGEEYTEEISGEQFSEEESFSEQESVSEANTEEGAEKAEAFAEETAEAEQEYTGPCVREYHYEEKVKKLNLTKKLEEAKAAGKIRYIGFSFQPVWFAASQAALRLGSATARHRVISERKPVQRPHPQAIRKVYPI